MNEGLNSLFQVAQTIIRNKAVELWHSVNSIMSVLLSAQKN